MSCFLLLHGSWHGAWCWEKLRPYLEAQGHTVLTPDLPGHGSNNTSAKPLKKIRFLDYVTTVVEQLKAQRDPVIVVAHSMAGTIVSQVADQCPDKIRQVVYIAAYILQKGQALVQAIDQSHQWVNTTPALEVVYDKEAQLFTLTEQDLRYYFYHDCPAAIVDWALQHQQLAEPSLPYFHKYKRTAAQFNVAFPKKYIICAHDRILNPESQRQFAQRAGCECIVINSGHSPFLSDVEDLASLLLAC